MSRIIFKFCFKTLAVYLRVDLLSLGFIIDTIIMINIYLPDNSKLELDNGATLADAAKKIGHRLFSDAVAGTLNDKLVDLNHPLIDGDKIAIVTGQSPAGLDVLRHSASHVMAQAVKELFPNVKFAIGPTVDNGFYYDFDLNHSLSTEDLPKIETKMREIIKRDIPIERQEMPVEQAAQFFNKQGQKYKVELIDELEDAQVSLYAQGDFTDLCRGPHVPSTKKIKAFKLLSVAGAYWRGDENRPMLQRVYGTAFSRQKDLDAYLKILEEAERRDHRLLGKQLDLFHIDSEVGPGLPLWHPKGALIRNIIENFWRDEHLKNGYELVMIPHIAKVDLWKTSGHWDFYRENMYAPMSVEGQDYIVKPMNCPGHIKIYKSKPRSYKEMPIRWAELGTVYRFERSGVLHGLLRVRGFTQDDAHIFCRRDQLEDEIISVIEFVLSMLKTFGFDQYDVYVSTRPKKYVGTLENWEKATSSLEKALDKVGLAYQVDPGEGVFYGPKIDLKIKDALGRAWQCTTIQVDFNLPERFDITYKGKENLDQRPIMIHRALLGSLERFIGCLIEHYAGAFPLWLAPVQVILVPIADRHFDYVDEIAKQFRAAGLRVALDNRSETVSRKVRDAQLQKIPYILIAGDREVTSGTVALRLRDGTDLGQKNLSDLVVEIKRENDSRSLTQFFTA